MRFYVHLEMEKFARELSHKYRLQKMKGAGRK